MAKKTRSLKTTHKKAARKKVARRAGGLGNLSVAELEAEIRKRQRGLGALLRKRERLQSQLAAVNAEIRALGGRPGGSTGRTRPRNTMSLVEALQKTLKGKEMSVTEVAQAVQDNGYTTHAENFRVIVNQALLSNKQFRKVSRGVYTVR